MADIMSMLMQNPQLAAALGMGRPPNPPAMGGQNSMMPMAGGPTGMAGDAGPPVMPGNPPAVNGGLPGNQPGGQAGNLPGPGGGHITMPGPGGGMAGGPQVGPATQPGPMANPAGTQPPAGGASNYSKAPNNQEPTGEAPNQRPPQNALPHFPRNRFGAMLLPPGGQVGGGGQGVNPTGAFDWSKMLGSFLQKRGLSPQPGMVGPTSGMGGGTMGGAPQGGPMPY